MTQFWNGAQKMRFVSSTLGTHICVHNPTTYNFVPLTKATAAIPINAGPNVLQGGVEFAAASIPLEWPELDYAEYQQLAAYHLQPSTMIDMLDNGYLGWLILGSWEPPAGVATIVGKCKGAFVVSKPANGLSSVINTLANGATISAIVSAGGSIAASTTLCYGLTLWSSWGESLIGPILTVSTGSTANAMIQLSWTAPTSGYFRRARLYVATSAATLVAASSANVKADVYASWNQTFTDYCGMSGVNSVGTIPSVNQAYTGLWAGSLWQNAT